MFRVPHLSFFTTSFLCHRVRGPIPGAQLAWLVLAILSGASTFAASPDYLRTALANFSPEIAPKWAYTLTTERDGKQLVERFNPSKPPTEQWTLLRTEGHVPTTEDTEKYFRYKASQAPGAIQATFHKNDIEPGTVKLTREDTVRAEYTCAFREQSANADKMLAHLQLQLSINKQSAYVESYRLVLNMPYSPVLTVKMNELVATMDFSAPENGRPNLPSRSSSHFKGRIFFVPFEENIRFEYSDFAPAS
jgi:hypothetical protein